MPFSVHDGKDQLKTRFASFRFVYNSLSTFQAIYAINPRLTTAPELVWGLGGVDLIVFHVGSYLSEPMVVILQRMLDHERHERKAERQGRLRAEAEMKRLQYQRAASLSPEGIAVVPPALSSRPAGGANTDQVGPLQGLISYPVRPIGTIQSCFSQRSVKIPMGRDQMGNSSLSTGGSSQRCND